MKKTALTLVIIAAMGISPARAEIEISDPDGIPAFAPDDSYSVVIGSGAMQSSAPGQVPVSSVLIGENTADSGGGGSVMIGKDAQGGWSSQDAVLVGRGAGTGAGSGATAIGAFAVAGQGGDTSIGSNSSAWYNSVAVGSGASAGGVNSTAIGNGSVAANDGVAIGNGAVGFNNSVAIGNGSVANVATDDSPVVSFGDVGHERRLINALDGVEDSDVATVGQMNAAIAASIGIDQTARDMAAVADAKADMAEQTAVEAKVTADQAVAENATQQTTLDDHGVRITALENKPDPVMDVQVARDIAAADVKAEAAEGAAAEAGAKADAAQRTAVRAETKAESNAATLISHDARIVGAQNSADVAKSAANIADDKATIAQSTANYAHERINQHDVQISNLEGYNQHQDQVFKNHETRISGLENRIDHQDQRLAALDTKSSRGIASIAAMQSVTPSRQGKTAVGIGVGHYGGETALAFNVAHAVMPEPGEQFAPTISFGIGMAGSGGNAVVRAGTAWEF